MCGAGRWVGYARCSNQQQEHRWAQMGTACPPVLGGITDTYTHTKSTRHLSPSHSTHTVSLLAERDRPRRRREEGKHRPRPLLPGTAKMLPKSPSRGIRPIRNITRSPAAAPQLRDDAGWAYQKRVCDGTGGVGALLVHERAGPHDPSCRTAPVSPTCILLFWFQRRPGAASEPPSPPPEQRMATWPTKRNHSGEPRAGHRRRPLPLMADSLIGSSRQ